jgi:peptide deformylase
MAIRNILQIGDPLLKNKNNFIRDFNASKIKKVIEDLVETMKDTNLLIGIAAPQIGENYQMIATEIKETKTRAEIQSDELRIYINPKITFYSKTQIVAYEGCGSVNEANLFGPVKRPKEIIIEAFNPKGQKFRLHCDGLLSRVIQHEYDHLFGIEFIEKVIDYKKMMNRDFYIEKIKDSKKQIQASITLVKELLE